MATYNEPAELLWSTRLILDDMMDCKRRDSMARRLATLYRNMSLGYPGIFGYYAPTRVWSIYDLPKRIMHAIDIVPSVGVQASLVPLFWDIYTSLDNPRIDMADEDKRDGTMALPWVKDPSKPNRYVEWLCLQDQADEEEMSDKERHYLIKSWRDEIYDRWEKDNED